MKKKKMYVYQDEINNSEIKEDAESDNDNV